MYVDKVKYTAQYDEYGVVRHRWIGIDVALTEKDDPEKAFQLAKEMTEHFHKKSNPHLEGTTITDAPGPSQEIQIERPKNRIEALIADINSCKEVEVLKSYQLIARADAKLLMAYNEKMEQLTQNKK